LKDRKGLAMKYNSTQSILYTVAIKFDTTSTNKLPPVWPKSLGEEISKFLNENKNLELIEIKYSSFGFLLSNNREENYTALVICKKN
jgi:hypothetical protein